MKNTRIQPLILITCIFAAFLVGLFTGRNINRAPVQIQAIPAAASPTTPAVPTKETVAAEDASEAATAKAEIININTATSGQLQTLPNIGPKTAEKIIAYRDEHGAFGSISELINVSGIGEKTLEALWDLVTTGG